MYRVVSCHRTRYSWALERAVEWAGTLRLPLLILDNLPIDYPHASLRFHRYALDGMADLASAFDTAEVAYYPFVECEKGESSVLFDTLARDASVIISDDFPTRYGRMMADEMAKVTSILTEMIDSNGLLPLTAASHAYPTAYAFRRFLQKELPAYLADFPHAKPLRRLSLPHLKGLPNDILRRWPKVQWDRDLPSPSIAQIPVVNNIRGGQNSARKTLKAFVSHQLTMYGLQRNEPDLDACSNMSPYLHRGHISVWEIFQEIAEAENWSLENLITGTSGKRTGWWGMSADAEAFLDQLVTWRELGYNFCHHRKDYDRAESLPLWAQTTLKKHDADIRPHRYSRRELENAETHDALWNAAQIQLVREGRIHNYLRMLWGKKILEWTTCHEEAANVMIELNDRYALDGCNPNSYSGIFWVLGRYDRPWGPERAVFGNVRYMSSRNTARKVQTKKYLEKYSSIMDGG